MDLFDLFFKKSKICLERSYNGLDAERFELLRFVHVADNSGDFKRTRAGMGQKASQNGASDVAWMITISLAIIAVQLCYLCTHLWHQARAWTF